MITLIKFEGVGLPPQDYPQDKLLGHANIYQYIISGQYQYHTLEMLIFAHCLPRGKNGKGFVFREYFSTQTS